MSYATISAILKGRWLVNKQWAESQMPLVMQMLEGTPVSFTNNPQSNLEEAAPSQPQLAAKNVYAVHPSSDIAMLPQGSIALITLAGPLLKRGDVCSYGMVDHANSINQLAAAQNIAGIILNIDSPGGQADGTALLADAVKAASNIKPVIGIIQDGMAASAAMWVASACTELYVTQATDMVGSIGVYTTIADWNKYYQSKGLDVKDIYAPQSTDKNKSYHDALAGNEDALKAELEVLANQFINTIATNRAATIKGNDWKTGKMFYANEAQKIGLIDGIKSFSEVVHRFDYFFNKNTQNSNNMAFEKTLAAAQATEFNVTDNGFALEETHLNNIEAAIAELETSMIEKEFAATTAATNLATEMDLRLAAEGALQTANATIAEQLQTIASLQQADAGAVADAIIDEDKNPTNQVVVMEMDFQKELLEKLN